MTRDMGLEKLLAGIHSVDVKSQACGNMTVEIRYHGATSDDPKVPGFPGRMAIADELTKTLLYRIRRAKWAIVKVKA